MLRKTTITYQHNGQWWASKRTGDVVVCRKAGKDAKCAEAVATLMTEKRKQGERKNP